jgi:Putative Actinobacterial Holin-X, holin superfamily III
MEPDSKSTEGTTQGNGLDQASISELMRRLSEQASTLARKEVELATAEVAQKGKRLGVGAGALGAAAIVGLFALGALTAALILALETGVAGWLAALIVAVVYGVIAGGLALAGKQQVEAGSPPVPERAIESTKLDIDAAKAGAKEGRDG